LQNLQNASNENLPKSATSKNKKPCLSNKQFANDQKKPEILMPAPVQKVVLPVTMENAEKFFCMDPEETSQKVKESYFEEYVTD
jgi:hypothetical protein